MARKILVVDDEESIVKIIEYNLKKEWYEVLRALTGKRDTNSPLRESLILYFLT